MTRALKNSKSRGSQILSPMHMSAVYPEYDTPRIAARHLFRQSIVLFRNAIVLIMEMEQEDMKAAPSAHTNREGSAPTACSLLRSLVRASALPPFSRRRGLHCGMSLYQRRVRETQGCASSS